MMVDRTNAERQHCYIARLKALAAAEARIQEMSRHNATAHGAVSRPASNPTEADKDNAFKPFTSWKSRTPTLDDLRERMAALIRDLPKD
jgi:hypothetical protein